MLCIICSQIQTLCSYNKNDDGRADGRRGSLLGLKIKLNLLLAAKIRFRRFSLNALSNEKKTKKNFMKHIPFCEIKSTHNIHADTIIHHHVRVCVSASCMSDVCSRYMRTTSGKRSKKIRFSRSGSHSARLTNTVQHHTESRQAKR